MTTNRDLVEVAVNAPLLDKLTYLQNADFKVSRGDVVEVPLGKRKVNGVVVTNDSQVDPKAEFELKPIALKKEELPALKDPFLKWLEWVAEYYMHPLGQVMQLCFPALDKKTSTRKSSRAAVIPNIETKAKPNLTEEQSVCLNQINLVKDFSVHLIHGVTGSGKTEIYLRLFEKTLEQGKRGLFLVPEISLTPQLLNRFVERFGDQVAVLHSQLTDRERTNQWWDIVDGKKKILIGARSALFCPIDDLDLIVVDEEHESSFKQDEKLKYNGRDAAIMLAKFLNCKIVLGSATPSLETWKNAVDGKFHLHQLKNRVENRPLPKIEILDMRTEKDNPDRWVKLPYWMSQKLFIEMQNTLAKKEQVALLLNRRGMAQVMFCQSCGYSAECPNCDIGLTLHGRAHLVCHYCDYHENFKEKCPDCSEGVLSPMGVGTEKIEEDLKLLFPDHIIARADRDEVTSRSDLESLISKMENSEIDILIGTQMIAKGLDFPKLKLVGLVLADIGFNLPDFRAAEKSFQLITQMSGRSGRHVQSEDDVGLVILQTYNIEHECLEFAKNHDFEGFARHELKNREQLRYPPYNKLVSVRVQSMSLDKVRKTCSELSHRARALQQAFDAYQQLQVLGPAQAPLAKLRNQFRYHIIFKEPRHNVLNQFIKTLFKDSSWIPNQVKVLIDVDPLNLL